MKGFLSREKPKLTFEFLTLVADSLLRSFAMVRTAFFWRMTILEQSAFEQLTHRANSQDKWVDGFKTRI